MEVEQPDDSRARPRRPLPWRAALAGLGVALLAVLAGLRFLEQAWSVAAVEGRATLDGEPLAAGARFGVGSLFATSASATARLWAAGVAEIAVLADTRVRLVGSTFARQRLFLEHGALDVRTFAPPGLFVVELGDARAVDLGCAYRLERGADGRTRLDVRAGMVRLESGGRAARVPTGFSCETARGRLGVPLRLDAPDAWRAAALAVAAGAPAPLEAVLDEARAADALTLIHLLERVEAPARARVLARLDALQPPPAGLERAALGRGDAETLERWRADLLDCTVRPRGAARRALRALWSLWVDAD